MYQRPILRKLISYLNLDRIVVLKGPRRTGKSTLLYQIIDSLILNGVSPQSILYLSFDDIDARAELSLIIKAYEEILSKNIAETKETYCLLDEVHFLDNWSFQIKKYFDRKFPIKFIVSGSSASLIKKGAESLAGRTVEEIILPFSFKEYLAFKTKDKALFEILDQIKFNLSTPSLPHIAPLTPYQREITLLFQEYLKRGGFPNVLNIKEDMLWQKLLREDVIQKVIYRDLVEYFGIKKPLVLEKLLIYLADHSSEILNLTSISNSLNLSRPYAEKYLDYLQQAYLVFTLMKYSRSIEARIRSSHKVHLIDSGLISSLSRGNEDKVMESVIGHHLFFLPLLYWRNRFEVDFVIDQNPPLPIEVKNKSTLDPTDFKGLFSFMDKFKVNSGILISKETLENKHFEDRAIYCLPAWLFCLLLGNRG